MNLLQYVYYMFLIGEQMRFVSRCHNRRFLATTYEIANVKIKKLDKKVEMRTGVKDRHLG